jgi:hypothetical protein
MSLLLFFQCHFNLEIVARLSHSIKVVKGNAVIHPACSPPEVKVWVVKTTLKSKPKKSPQMFSNVSRPRFGSPRAFDGFLG